MNNYSQSNLKDELKQDKKLNDEKGFLFEEKEEPNETEDMRNKPKKISYDIVVQILDHFSLVISIVQKENKPIIQNKNDRNC